MLHRGKGGFDDGGPTMKENTNFESVTRAQSCVCLTSKCEGIDPEFTCGGQQFTRLHSVANRLWCESLCELNSAKVTPTPVFTGGENGYQFPLESEMPCISLIYRTLQLEN